MFPEHSDVPFLVDEFSSGSFCEGLPEFLALGGFDEAFIHLDLLQFTLVQLVLNFF